MQNIARNVLRKTKTVVGLSRMIPSTKTPFPASENTITATKYLSNCVRFYSSKSLKFGSADANSKRVLCTKTSVNYHIRKMEKKDLPSIFKMLDDEGWIMEKAYLKCAFETDPTGFVVAVTDDSEVIGSHGFLSHGEEIATMGLWMVKKEYRHLNIGLQLYEELKTHLGDQNCGTFVWPYYQDKIKEDHGVNPHKTYMTWYNYGNVNPKTFTNLTKEDFDIVPAKDIPLQELLGYDTHIHTVPREGYMKRWLEHKDSKTYVAKRKGKIVGYGVLRSQDHYNQIAPLYADDKSVAKGLFRALATEVPKNSKVGFSSPFENSSATEIAAVNGMLKPGIPLVMLYEKNPVNVDTSKVYAVSSNSFGTC